MLQILFFIITLTHANYCQAEYKKLPQPSEPIQYVQIFTRHGDRAPMYKQTIWPFYCYTKNVISDEETSHEERRLCEQSELTIKGQNQLTNLGNHLRHYFRNVEFDYKTPKNIYVRSSNIQRTIASALNMLKGLYGLNQPSIDDFEQFEIRKELDNLSWNFYNCKRNEEIFKNYNVDSRRENEGILKMMRIMNVTEKDPTKYRFSHSNDYLNALKCHGEDLPCSNGECLDENDYDQIWKQNLKEHNDLFGNLENTNTLIGFFVKDIIEMTNKHIQQRLDNTNDIKIAYFSGHDTTLYPLLPIFGFSVEDWPPYASHMMIEFVGESLDELKVRVSFNGSVAQLPFCENKEYCELSTYLNHLQTFIPSPSMC